MENPLIPNKNLPARSPEGPEDFYDTFLNILNKLKLDSQEINPNDSPYVHIKKSLSAGTNPLKSLREKFPGEWIFNPSPTQINSAEKMYMETRQEFIYRCEDMMEGKESNAKLPSNKPWLIAYIPNISDKNTKAFTEAKRVN